ncbi:MAG: putative metal-binding motif-containing protein, partial [Deltaproteobacteria bacterium]|nr:putative metal-binding motif-containing protein [Deltaproteobacteria bacterium]
MLALLLACASDPADTEKEPGATGDDVADADGDGFATTEGDCDDNDSAVYPGATERCDNLDNDCDGTVDDDLVQSWYADADGDGFGNAEQAVTACEPPDGTYIADDSDCDDTRGDVYPSAPELCDGLDNDCDGQADEDDATSWYADADGDGYGDDATAQSACTAPGAGWVTEGGDCDDTRDDAFPGNPETCDEIDNDCNGLVDDGVLLTWYEDRDADGHGNAAEVDEACRQPTGYVEAGDDCDDNDPAVGPAAPEVCNGLDDDCDGLVDSADPDVDPSTGAVYYADSDGDGYGDDTSTTTACDLPAGFTTDNTDCDDTAADVSPAGTERCNGVDDDCDGVIDPSTSADALAWYADTDGDGYGDPSTATTSCDAPAGHVADDTDCDDAHYAISPGASEVCNWEDDDCDGLVDDDDPSLDLTTRSTWY